MEYLFIGDITFPDLFSVFIGGENFKFICFVIFYFDTKTEIVKIVFHFYFLDKLDFVL